MLVLVLPVVATWSVVRFRDRRAARSLVMVRDGNVYVVSSAGDSSHDVIIWDSLQPTYEVSIAVPPTRAVATAAAAENTDDDPSFAAAAAEVNDRTTDVVVVVVERDDAATNGNFPPNSRVCFVIRASMVVTCGVLDQNLYNNAGVVIMLE